MIHINRNTCNFVARIRNSYCERNCVFTQIIFLFRHNPHPFGNQQGIYRYIFPGGKIRYHLRFRDMLTSFAFDRISIPSCAAAHIECRASLEREAYITHSVRNGYRLPDAVKLCGGETFLRRTRFHRISAYIRGSMPRTGWPFSVSQFSSSSPSVVTVSSAIMSQKFSMP